MKKITICLSLVLSLSVSGFANDLDKAIQAHYRNKVLKIKVDGVGAKPYPQYQGMLYQNAQNGKVEDAPGHAEYDEILPIAAPVQIVYVSGFNKGLFVRLKTENYYTASVGFGRQQKTHLYAKLNFKNLTKKSSLEQVIKEFSTILEESTGSP